MSNQTTVSSGESENATSEAQVTLGSFGNGGDIERNTVPPHKNPRWLRRQYHTHGKPIPEMAVEAGVPGREIVNRMDEFDISFLGPKLPVEIRRKLYSEGWLREKYKESQKALIEIAEDLGVSRTAVKKSIEQYGIGLRSEPEIKLTEEVLNKLENKDWLRGRIR